MALRKLSIARKGSSSNVRAQSQDSKSKSSSRRSEPNSNSLQPPAPSFPQPPSSPSSSARAPSLLSGDVTPSDSPSSSVRQKKTLGGKAKRRLSTLFNPGSRSNSANNLAALAPKDPRGSTAVNASATQNAAPSTTDTTSRYSALDARGAPPQATTDPSLAQRSASSGTATGYSLVPNPTPASPLPNGTADAASTAVNGQVGSVQRSTSNRNSLYSVWGLDDESDEESDSDAYATPDEGLSEIGEEDEDDLDTAGKGTAAPSIAATSSSAGPRLRRVQVDNHTKVHHKFKRGNPADVDQAGVLAADLDTCRQVLTMFLRSQMKEAEEMLNVRDPQNNHMYLQSGHGIIQSLKGLMTFDGEDLSSALEISRATSQTATSLRHPTESVLSRLGGLVGRSQGLARVRAMTVLERHAELTYAETILIKAILSIVSSGDWFGLIREALNMRTAHGIYMNLEAFLEESDKNGFDEDIDMDFRSGVLLGTGTSSLMLSLLPGKVLKIAEVFGYAGDRTVAINKLMAAGGWTPGVDEPAYTEANEGIRRPVCDTILLTFHLVISVLMPVSDVDIPTARRILKYNMERYPNGIFFLYFQARLWTNMCEPELANESLRKALDLDLEYVQLQHMCLWDYGCNGLVMNEWAGARQAFDILRQESNWSRAVYTYAAAATLMELVAERERNGGVTEDSDNNDKDVTTERVIELVNRLPKLTKKIAGKSLPIEKALTRKARKFLAQGNRLFLPGMELSYLFSLTSYIPRWVLLSRWVPRITADLERLEATGPEKWGEGYWDDYALGHFLRGVAQFIARYQPPNATENARRPNPNDPSDAELDAAAERDLKLVIENTSKVMLDHWILYHAHYELGRLYAARGKAAAAANGANGASATEKSKGSAATHNALAAEHFEVVMSGRLPVPNTHNKGQGKYSLEGALQLKTLAAQQNLPK